MSEAERDWNYAATSWGIPKANRIWKKQESPHLEALVGAWPYEHLEFKFLTSKTVIKYILFLNNLPMSIIIRPSADNDIAEAILLMMWLRYLTGQWERDFELERDGWHPPTTYDRSSFQGSLRWLSIITWHLKYPVKFQFLNNANAESDMVRETVIIGWESTVAGTAGTSLFCSCNFAPRTDFFILGRGTSIYLVDQGQHNWKIEEQRHFPPWIASILHRGWHIARGQKRSQRMKAITIRLESLNWLIFMMESPCLLWFCGWFAVSEPGGPLFVSRWFHEVLSNLWMQICSLMMTRWAEGNFRISVGGVQVLVSAQLLTIYPNLDRAQFNRNY